MILCSLLTFQSCLVQGNWLCFRPKRTYNTGCLHQAVLCLHRSPMFWLVLNCLTCNQHLIAVHQHRGHVMRLLFVCICPGDSWMTIVFDVCTVQATAWKAHDFVGLVGFEGCFLNHVCGPTNRIIWPSHRVTPHHSDTRFKWGKRVFPLLSCIFLFWLTISEWPLNCWCGFFLYSCGRLL